VKPMTDGPRKVVDIDGFGGKPLREWLVIEDSRAYGVFASDEERANKVMGYIPRDIAEPLLGRSIEDGRHNWFTRVESEKMHAHPEWRDELP
jgi:hypothetical protein